MAVALGLASVLYIKLIRVSPDSPISSNLEHLANLIESAERLNDMLLTINQHTQGLLDRKSTRLNSSHSGESRMPSSA